MNGDAVSQSACAHLGAPAAGAPVHISGGALVYHQDRKRSPCTSFAVSDEWGLRIRWKASSDPDRLSSVVIDSSFNRAGPWPNTM